MMTEQVFGVVLHKTSNSRMLHRIGITPQKPIRRAIQRNDLEIMRWVETEFPAVVRESRRLRATLLFLDETGVHGDASAWTTWGQRGQTPVAETR